MHKGKPGLSIAAWAQYVLDNFSSVAEAVAVLETEPFTVVTAQVPGESRLATLHLSMSDASGDSAIIEYIDGKQVIHHDRRYQVMTNSPAFDAQLAMNAYWQSIGGTVMLPAPIGRRTVLRGHPFTSMPCPNPKIRARHWPAYSV